MGDKTKGGMRFWRKGKKNDGGADPGEQDNHKLSKTRMRGRAMAMAGTPKIRIRGKSKAAQLALESGSAPIPVRESRSHPKSSLGNSTAGQNGNSKMAAKGKDNDHNNINNGPVTPPSLKNTAKQTKIRVQHRSNRAKSGSINGTGIHDYDSYEYASSTRTSSSQPSSVFTPKTMPPTPSPTKVHGKGNRGLGRIPGQPQSSLLDNNKWQEADEEIKIQSMSRLHDLAREHAKNLEPGSHTIRQNMNHASTRTHKNTNNAYANTNTNASTKNLSKKSDQKIMDAVLGINELACVPQETKTVIQNYASKPTSPSTVVNLQMIKNGSFRVLDLAKESMGKLMNCAADLRDLNDNEELCAWEDHKQGYEYDEHEHEDDSRHMRMRDDVRSTELFNANVARRITYTNYDDGEDYLVDDDHERRTVKVGGRLHSPISNLTDSERTASRDESLRQVMGRWDRNQRYDDNVSSHRRGRERHRHPALDQSTHIYHSEQHGTGATTGLTTFRSLRSGPQRSFHRSGSPQPESTRYELTNADPTTNNIPFDERSDIYRPVADALLTSASVNSSSVVGGLGLGLQLAESDLYARRADVGNDHGQYLPLKTSSLMGEI